MNRDLENIKLAELLARIDWLKHPELARLVLSDIFRAKSHASAIVSLGRPCLLTGRMKREIVRRRRAGEAVNDIADRYGVHRSTVYRALAETNGRRPWHRRESRDGR